MESVKSVDGGEDKSPSNGTAEPDEFDQLPVRVCRAMKEARARVMLAASARMLWEQELTSAEKKLLGDDLEAAWRHEGTVRMWMRVRGVSRRRAILDLAVKLDLMSPGRHRWLLREVGESCDDAQEAIEEAVQTKRLVLIEKPRAAYWHGKAIDIDWEKRRAPWDYFWELCWRALRDESVDDSCFSNRKPGYSAKQMSRLSKLQGFPGDLSLLIDSTKGSQKLKIAPDKICLLRWK